MATETSYLRPIDRPHTIICRTCGKEQNVKPQLDDPKGWPPKDLTTWKHGHCPNGSMVYVYEVADKPPEKPVPHCGNPSCDGTCSDLLCLPPAPAPVREVLVGVPKFWRVLAIWALLADALLAGALAWRG